MADLKISALTSATTPLAGTEVLPMVQSSTTVKVATNDLTVRNVRANATTGILQVTGPGTGTTRVMTTPDANFSAARIDAAQTFVGNQTFSGSTVDVSVAGTASYSPTAAPTYNLGLFTTGAANSRYTSFAINSRGTSGQGQTCYITCVPGASDGDASLRFSTYGGYGVSEALNLTKDQDVSVTKGNLIQGTAAKGVNFTANTPLAGMTTQLLNWYEEGTWTPTWNGGTITTIVFARYTRIGKLIHCELGVVLGSSVGLSDSTISLPWTGISGAGGGSIGYYSGGATPYLYLIPDSTIFKMRSSAFVGAYTQADMAGTTLYCSFSYIAA